MNEKIKKVQLFLKSNQIDSILFNSKTMKKWLNTLTGSGCHVFITQESSYLIVDGRYINEAKEKEKDLTIILHNPHLTDKSYHETIASLLKSDGCQNIGIEANNIVIKDYEKIKEYGVEIKRLDEDITNLRIIKTSEEIEKIKKVIAMTDQVYQKVISKIYVGISEIEISALLQYYSYSLGAQQMSFDTVVTSGERTALPHGRPTSRCVKKHEPILIDFGIQYDNYQSDMTRVCFIGEPTPQIKEIYDITLKAQKAGLNAIRSGVKACEVDKAARTVIQKAGYGDYFDHGLGHGIGIGDGSEGPILNSKSRTILGESMIMSCEPGIYIPGVGGIRIEDDVVIINGEGMALNKTTKEYIILEDK